MKAPRNFRTKVEKIELQIAGRPFRFEPGNWKDYGVWIKTDQLLNGFFNIPFGEPDRWVGGQVDFYLYFTKGNTYLPKTKSALCTIRTEDLQTESAFRKWLSDTLDKLNFNAE
jgi:hypothetical protein